MKSLPDNKYHRQCPVISVLRCSFGEGWDDVFRCQKHTTTQMQTSTVTHHPSRFISIVLGTEKHNLFPSPNYLALEARREVDCTLLIAIQKQHLLQDGNTFCHFA